MLLVWLEFVFVVLERHLWLVAEPAQYSVECMSTGVLGITNYDDRKGGKAVREVAGREDILVGRVAVGRLYGHGGQWSRYDPHDHVASR